MGPYYDGFAKIKTDIPRVSLTCSFEDMKNIKPLSRDADGDVYITTNDGREVLQKWLSDCAGYSAVGLRSNQATAKYKMISIPIPTKIIYNGPATIVFWVDGTKTIVKKSKKEKDNKYNAFCAALAKKIYGSNSNVNRIVKSGIEEK